MSNQRLSSYLIRFPWEYAWEKVSIVGILTKMTKKWPYGDATASELIIKRDNERRVDLYLFNTRFDREYIRKLFRLVNTSIKIVQYNQNTLDRTDMRLLIETSRIAGILRDKNQKAGWKSRQLFTFVVHYIMNELGVGYEGEIEMCRTWSKRMEKVLKSREREILTKYGRN